MHSLKFKFFRFGERFASSPFAFVLSPISWVWGLVSKIRNFLYDRRWIRVERVNVPVVSVGNLSAGGTGKTPLVILLARQFPDRKIAVLARGYGARKGELNDEMEVIRRHIPGARLYQGVDRVALARQAEEDGAELILVDDGFQYRRLHRDFDLVVVRNGDFFDTFLPRGRLRESPDQLKRGDARFSYEPVEGAIRLKNRCTRIVDLKGQEISSIRGERVALFCGIGNPKRFKELILSLGAEIAAEKYLADHEPFLEWKELNVKYLVCTEKDYVKLGAVDLPIVWIEIEAEVAEGEDQWQNLIAKIGASIG